MMKKISKKIVIVVGLVIVVLLFAVVLPLYQRASLRGKMNRYDLPEYAEVVLEPKVRTFSCSCGDRTNVEMVFKVPKENASEIKLGEMRKQNGIVIVASFPENDGDCGIVEHDCTYVYNRFDPSKFDFLSQEDGYCYYHVIMRNPYNAVTDCLVGLYDNMLSR